MYIWRIESDIHKMAHQHQTIPVHQVFKWNFTLFSEFMRVDFKQALFLSKLSGVIVIVGMSCDLIQKSIY